MKLDVGCGTHGVGDVNCDLYVKDAGHRDGKTIDTQATPNFVCCSAQNLPFIDRSFETVFSSHVIEHVPNAFQMLTELIRVSKSDTVIRCPHKDGSGAHHPSHVNFLDFPTFQAWAKALGAHCDCEIRSYDSVVPFQGRQYIPTRLKKNRIFNAYLKFARSFLNPNSVVPQSARPPFEIEVRLQK